MTITTPDHSAPDHGAPDHGAPDHSAPDHSAPDHTGPATELAIADILITNSGADPDLFEGGYQEALVDLGIDSLAVLELEARVAARYGAALPEDAIEMSVAALVESINERLAA